MYKGDKHPILVTGAHRSGSTWAGKMIARSPDLAYLHEPFSIDPRSGICGGQFEYWFTYVCDSNASHYYEYLRNCYDFNYPLARKIKTIRSPMNAIRILEEWTRFTSRRALNKRPLVKDPLAVFSAEWLARTFDMDVIVLIRHPAAFAGSIKQANWPHPFRHFLNQPLLMRDHLSEFTTEIEAFSADERDIVDQAILLWNIIHSTILDYQNQHEEWCFVRHEDLSANPIGEFRRLFQRINLDYPIPVQDEILKYSHTNNAGKPQNLLSIRRDSKATIWNWRDRLTDEEIDRVKAGTRQLSSTFYDDGEW